MCSRAILLLIICALCDAQEWSYNNQYLANDQAAAGDQRQPFIPSSWRKLSQNDAQQAGIFNLQTGPQHGLGRSPSNGRYIFIKPRRQSVARRIANAALPNPVRRHGTRIDELLQRRNRVLSRAQTPKSTTVMPTNAFPQQQTKIHQRAPVASPSPERNAMRQRPVMAVSPERNKFEHAAVTANTAPPKKIPLWKRFTGPIEPTNILLTTSLAPFTEDHPTINENVPAEGSPWPAPTIDENNVKDDSSVELVDQKVEQAEHMRTLAAPLPRVKSLEQILRARPKVQDNEDWLRALTAAYAKIINSRQNRVSHQASKEQNTQMSGVFQHDAKTMQTMTDEIQPINSVLKDGDVTMAPGDNQAVSKRIQPVIPFDPVQQTVKREPAAAANQTRNLPQKAPDRQIHTIYGPNGLQLPRNSQNNHMKGIMRQQRPHNAYNSPPNHSRQTFSGGSQEPVDKWPLFKLNTVPAYPYYSRGGKPGVRYNYDYARWMTRYGSRHYH